MLHSVQLLATALLLLAALPLAAQPLRKVEGRVVDETGTPMAGVSVFVKEVPAVGMITDVNGRFSLGVSHDARTLVCSYLGYAESEQVIADRFLEITMQPDAQALDEVVVVGYGSQRKKDLTGGLTVVGQEALQMVASSNLMDRLVGQIAGVSITTGDAKPGSNQSLRIRGINSLSGGNSPLIVLDGIPYEGSLADIDPNLIESMSVLKDASSVAIYGSRGSNGVILIQTKRGSKGSLHVTYKGSFTYAQPMKRIEVMGPNEFIRFKQDMGRLGSKGYTGVQLDPMAGLVISASEKVNYAQGITHDWQDYVFRESFQMDHQLSISGGNDRTTYSAAAAYLDQPGVVYNSNYKRINVYGSINQTLNKWLVVGLTTQFINGETGGLTPNLEHAIKQSPYGIYKTETGGYYDEPMDYSNLPNPMRNVNADNKNTSHNVLLNGYIELRPVEELSIKSQFGYNNRNSFKGTYYGRNTVTGMKVDGRAEISNSTTTDWTWENIAKYEKNFGEHHHLDVTGLFSMQEKKNISSSQSGEGFVNDDSSFYRMSGAEKNIAVSSSYWKETMLSYMLRLNYGYKGRYLFTLTGRADGASVFGRNNKYGFFPSAAFAWHLGEESFVKDNASWIDMLKIRLSYGANGNNAISRYSTLDRLYSTNGVKYIWGDGSTAVNSAYLPSNGIGNPNLTWETTYTANVGIDFEFFNGRLGGSLDMYLSNTHDLLMRRTIPIMNGYSSIWDNVGQTRNKGVELSLHSQNIRKKDFVWATDFNFFLNRDEIVELRGDGIDDINNKWFIGQPLSVYYDYNVVGIWQQGDEFTFIHPETGVETPHQTGAKPGDAKLEDVNGDGIIDNDDRKVIGSKNPSFTLSMGNRFEYKDFYFSFLINGLFGRWMEDNIADIGQFTFGTSNYIAGARYWTPERPDADYVSPGYTKVFSHSYYKKENYIWIKSITLGYRFKPELLRKLRMSAIDINLSVNNPWVFSNMPQMLNYDNTWFASYPTARSYVLGITLTF